MEATKTEKAEGQINYYVIAGILISILFFIVANAIEPQINEQLDFFELIFVLAYAAPAVFSFSLVRGYGRKTLFGRAYLSLGIAYAVTSIGAFLFDYYQMIGVENPYPSWIDVLFGAFYPFAIYHLRTNIYFIRRVQKPVLKKSHIALLIIIPLGVTSLYAFGLSTNVSFTEEQIYDDDSTLNLMPRVLSHMRFTPVEEHDQQFWNGFYTGIFFVAATTFTFTWAIIGAQVFRGSILGAPWGLLLVGIGLNTVADVSYYYTSIYAYDRTNLIIGVWVLGCMLVSYALYLHKRKL
jgi:hypothetical protein